MDSEPRTWVELPDWRTCEDELERLFEPRTCDEELDPDVLVPVERDWDDELAPRTCEDELEPRTCDEVPELRVCEELPELLT